MRYKGSSCNQSCRKDTGVTWNKHLHSAVSLGGKQDKISEDGNDMQHMQLKWENACHLELIQGQLLDFSPQ